MGDPSTPDSVQKLQTTSHAKAKAEPGYRFYALYDKINSELLFRGHPEVVDADLADYFGSIPHAELLKSVSRRIVDRRVLHLIKM